MKGGQESRGERKCYETHGEQAQDLRSIVHSNTKCAESLKIGPTEEEQKEKANEHDYLGKSKSTWEYP